VAAEAVLQVKTELLIHLLTEVVLELKLKEVLVLLAEVKLAELCRAEALLLTAQVEEEVILAAEAADILNLTIWAAAAEVLDVFQELFLVQFLLKLTIGT
jgi:hypothetical protein